MGRCYSLPGSMLLSYSIETGSLPEPEVRLADNKPQRSPYPTASSRGIDTWKLPEFFVGCRHLNSGPHASTGRVLTH